MAATEREMLARLALSDQLGAAAAEIARSLGAYACVHARMRDVADAIYGTVVSRRPRVFFLSPVLTPHC